MLNLKQINKDIIPFFLSLTVFFLPLSNSLKSIFLPLTAIAIFLNPDFRKQALSIIKEPWCKAAFILFFVVVLGLFNLADWKTKLTYLDKYSKFLYLPLLAFAFQDKKTRQLAIHAFLLAMFITLFASYLKWLEWTPILKIAKDGGGGVIHNRIDTSLFVAFGAYFAAELMVKSAGYLRLFYGFLCLLFSAYDLFYNSSKTGYIVFGVLFLVFLVQRLSWQRLVLLLPLCALGLAVITFESPVFKANVQQAFHNIDQFKAGDKNTSVGYRLQFANYAKGLIAAKPLLGHGTGGFAYQFSQDNPIPDWGPKLSDPHNQYLAFAVDYGLIGLTLLLYLFFSLFKASRHSKETQGLMFGLLCAFLVANWCDSFLLLSNGGYFFVIFAGLSLGESLLYSEKQSLSFLSKATLAC